MKDAFTFEKDPSSEIRSETGFSKDHSVAPSTVLLEVSRNLTVLYISDTVERLFGFPRDSWYESDSLIGRVCVEDRGRLLDCLTRLDDWPPPFSLSFRFLTRESDPKWVKLNVLEYDSRFFRGFLERTKAPFDHERVDATKLSPAPVLPPDRLRGCEHERRRIAAELHDGVGQWIALSVRESEMISLDLKTTDSKLSDPDREPIPQVLVRLQRLKKNLRSISEEIRRIAVGLRPALLEEDGLIAAIGIHAQRVAETGGLRLSLRLDEEAEPAREDAIHVFRIVQEALTNVIRHASAGSVKIKLRRQRERGLLEIRDNGIGFELGDVDPQKLGLSVLHERAGLIGGELSIERERGGVTLRLSYPLSRD